MHIGCSPSSCFSHQQCKRSVFCWGGGAGWNGRTAVSFPSLPVHEKQQGGGGLGMGGMCVCVPLCNWSNFCFHTLKNRTDAPFVYPFLGVGAGAILAKLQELEDRRGGEDLNGEWQEGQEVWSNQWHWTGRKRISDVGLICGVVPFCSSESCLEMCSWMMYPRFI